MKEDTKNVFSAIAFPTLIMVVVLGVGFVVMYTGKTMMGAADATSGIVVMMSGMLLGLGGLLYWDIATDIQLFRKEINDLKKLP